jgi:hypothetical protein
MTRLTGWIALACCWLGTLCFAQAGDTGQPPQTYVLYGWRDSAGSWNFTLFPGYISREFSRQEVYNSAGTFKGLDAFKQRISELSAGSTLVWHERVTDKGRYARLGFPPKDIVKEVRRYAEARKIEVVGP